MGTTVAMDDILEALELASDETSSYVNSRTGVVLTVSHEELRLAEEDSASEMPDWQREMVALAKQVLESDEWLELPSKFDIHEWEMMDGFAASQSSESAPAELPRRNSWKRRFSQLQERDSTTGRGRGMVRIQAASLRGPCA